MAQNASVRVPVGAIDEVLALWDLPDPWSYDPRELAEVQFQALRDRFGEKRPQLKVLDQRARDQKIDRIDDLPGLIPLLFSHTTYKSYPASFLSKGRWDMMTRWLGTLSTAPTDNVDLTGVTDVDGWVRAVHRAGHFVISSSGTTGHSSFVNQVAADRAMHRKCVVKTGEVVCGQKGEPVFPVFRPGAAEGWNMGGEQGRLVWDIYARPGGVMCMTQKDIAIAELDRLASIRKAIIDGTATPALIAGAEKEASERLTIMEAEIQQWLDKLFAHWNEPIYLFAGASMLWRVVEAGRARGVPDGSLHPGSIIRTGGGMKGFKGPADFYDDAERFLGIKRARWIHVYGMTELVTQFLKCKHNRYHLPPTTILMLLDKSGEHLVNQPSGVVEGRGGFFDLALHGRWGGVISGDRLTVDFSPCPCGRHSPSIIEVTRYKDLPEGDDKLTCAGQVDTYVRGLAGGDWQ